MEKNNLCSKLKTKQMHNEYNKFKWDYNNYSNNHVNNLIKEEDIMGFSWPPRSYTCSFCKREFKSAQALGGHMNVHRRDRARLRLSPSNRDTLFLGLDNLNPSLNSNPSSCSSYNSCTNPSLSSIFTKFPQFMNSAILSPVCPLSTASHVVDREDEVIKMEGHFGKFGSAGVKIGGRSLDLEIGLVSKSKDQELDLELRLGYT
ncbi:hypothetical protein CASFOL_005207 [Castilleja foliolosa]|uniref:C2H2-type domain-containing protein n=1 Tax=Castilleja foliolosa TaxID=1961234 RepID=A0ABD3E6S9_9LAMI